MALPCFAAEAWKLFQRPMNLLGTVGVKSVTSASGIARPVGAVLSSISP